MEIKNYNQRKSMPKHISLCVCVYIGANVEKKNNMLRIKRYFFKLSHFNSLCKCVFSSFRLTKGGKREKAREMGPDHLVVSQIFLLALGPL